MIWLNPSVFSHIAKCLTPLMSTRPAVGMSVAISRWRINGFFLKAIQDAGEAYPTSARRGRVRLQPCDLSPRIVY